MARIALGAILLLGGSAFGGPAMAGEPIARAPAAQQGQPGTGTTALSEMPTAEEIARHDAMVAAPTGARTPKLTAAGGEASVTVEWGNRGKGGYDTRVYGNVIDTEDDGDCARVDMWFDGKTKSVTKTLACPKGESQLVKGRERAWRVLVRMCAEKCTGWV